MRSSVALAFLLSATASPAGEVSEMVQWRGAGRDGRAGAFRVPARWPEALTLTWELPVGAGHSSPVVDGSRVYVHSREGEEEVVRALALEDGKEVWRDRYPAPYEVNQFAAAHGKGPKSTPALASGRLVTFGISGIITAYDAASGKRLWQREFSKEYPATSPLFGTAASPLVKDGLVIVPAGGHDKGALLALELESGRTRWSWDGNGPGYSSPVSGTLGGVEQLVLQMQEHLVGVDPKKGTLLWKLPFKTAYHQNCITPILAGNRIIHGGYHEPLAALEVLGDGASWKVHGRWSESRAQVFMSTPVLAGSRLFGFSNRNKGHLFALDAAAGTVLWEGPGRSGENAALLLAGDWLLALTTEAKLLVVRASGERFELEREYTVSERPVWAHPALTRKRILIKDATHLRSFLVE